MNLSQAANISAVATNGKVTHNIPATIFVIATRRSGDGNDFSSVNVCSDFSLAMVCIAMKMPASAA